MIQLLASRRLRWILLALTAALAGCAQQPPREPAPSIDTEVIPEVSPADSLEQAQRWLLDARQSRSRKTLRLILLATEAYLSAGNIPFARQAFDQLPAASLPGELHYLAILTEASLLLAEDRASAARSRLNQLSMELPLDALIRYHGLRARSYSLTGHHLEAAREWIWLEGLLADPMAQADNQRAIWQSCPVSPRPP